MSVATTDYSMVIGGEWAESGSGERIEATSPATGESLGTVPEGTRDDASRAIAAANEAWREWAATRLSLERRLVWHLERRDPLLPHLKWV